MHPDSEETARLIEEHKVEDNLEEDEGFSDVTDDPTVLEVLQAPASSTPDPTTSTFVLASSISTLAPGPSTLTPGTSTQAPGTSTLAPGPSTLVPGPSTLTPGTSTLTLGTSILAPSTVPSSLSSEAGGSSPAEDEDMAVDD
ncbi:uncharacterized protein [Trachinotus anak]|uniref:uncharacterized protein n=1 Tax=Trachinotus anak TaxID=443729 RepID=UPI0039F1F200